VSYKNLKAVMADLKEVYGAVARRQRFMRWKNSEINGTANTLRFTSHGRLIEQICRVSLNTPMKCTG